eukprot:491107_1
MSFCLVSLSMLIWQSFSQCTFNVLRDDYKALIDDGGYGRYFTFDVAAVDSILGRQNWSGDIFQIRIVNRGLTRNTYIDRGGHGRIQPYSSTKPHDWYVGDVLEFVDIACTTKQPTPHPTVRPTPHPTNRPTPHPTIRPTPHPTIRPTHHPTVRPTDHPTVPPTVAPTAYPSASPTRHPSDTPSESPSQRPTTAPTNAPSLAPSVAPSLAPSIAPSHPPTAAPTDAPSLAPSIAPSHHPTTEPSNDTIQPTVAPITAYPTFHPITAHPTTAYPSQSPTRHPSDTPSGSPTNAPSLAPSVAPSLAPSIAPSHPPTAAPTDAPSLAPSIAPSHPTTEPSNDTIQPTAPITTYPTAHPIVTHNCEDIGAFVWEDLMNSGTGIPETAHSLSIDDASLTLSIDIEADYLGYSGADNNGYVYGTAYVIDFDDFNAHRDSIKQPGNCQNRADVFGDPGLPWHDVWAYSTTPNNDGQVGTTAYLAYPPGNKWDVAMSSDDLCKVTYSASFTWDDLTRCTGYNGANGLYINTKDNEANITLSGTIYLNVVSPIDFGADYGFYRVYQLLSQPFMIVVSKTVYVLSDVGINLLTMHIIAVFKEDDGSTFELVVLTESAEYLRLSRSNLDLSYAQMFDPADDQNVITSTDLTALRTAETGENCLGNKDYICSQLWQITAADAQCTNGGTDFSGIYSIQFEAMCRNATEIGSGLSNYCSTWLGLHEEEIVDTATGKVLLQASLTWKDEICDAKIFEVQFSATMQFYEDATWKTKVSDAHLYEVGHDTVYVRVTTAYPSTQYDVFSTQLLNVWICTFDPLTPPHHLSLIGTGDFNATNVGCFSGHRDDNSDRFLEHIYDLEVGTTLQEFALDEVRTDLSSNQIQFEFNVPKKVVRDALYIHAEIEVSLGSGRRRRMVSARATKETNQMDHFVNKVGISSSPHRVHNPNPVYDKHPIEEPQSPVSPPWTMSWIYMAMVGLVTVVFTVGIVFMCVYGIGSRSRYAQVKASDSEYDSERDAINVVSNLINM